MSQSTTAPTELRSFDLPTRLFKWALVLLVLDAWLSNSYGAAWPLWHKINGYVLLVLIVFRLIWGAVGGLAARFSVFLRSPRAMIDYGRDLISGKSRWFLGHNPLGGGMIALLLFLCAAQGVTGLFSADPDHLVILGPLAHRLSDAGIDALSSLHGIIFNIILVCVSVHIAAAVFYTFVKRDPVIQGIIFGRKPMRPYEDGPFPPLAGLWLKSILALVLATILTLGSIVLCGGDLLNS